MAEYDTDSNLNSSDSFTEISKEHFIRVQNMAHLGSWKLDLNTNQISATEEASRIYGLKDRKLKIKDVQRIPLPEDRARLDAELKNLIMGKSVYDIEFRLKRVNDGQIRYIHSIAEYNKDENTVTGIIHDITEKKKMELTLSASEQRYRSLFENSVSGILYTDLKGEILEVNSKMLQLLGSPLVEQTKKINVLTFKLLVDVGFSDNFLKAIESGEDVYDHALYKSKWGTELYLEYNLTPIKTDGCVIGVMAKVEDITERKAAEHKIDSLLKEKDIILREVHHRIKNNMASVEGLLKLQLENSTNSDVKTELKDAVGRLSSMRILYEKLYQSEDFIQTSSGDYLTKLVDNIAEVFPENENIQFEKSFEDFMIPTDITFSLGIIINELLTNSLKYAFSQSVSAKIIKITARKNGTLVNIVVRDNGVGFKQPGEERDGGFGMQLITLLSEQIGGSAEFYNDDGAVFSISFNI